MRHLERKEPPRIVMMWAVLTSTWEEVARFPFHQKEIAEMRAKFLTDLIPPMPQPRGAKKPLTQYRLHTVQPIKVKLDS